MLLLYICGVVASKEARPDPIFVFKHQAPYILNKHVKRNPLEMPFLSTMGLPYLEDTTYPLLLRFQALNDRHSCVLYFLHILCACFMRCWAEINVNM